MGQEQDVLVGFVVATMFITVVRQDGVKGGGDDERGGCDCHEGRHGRCDRLVEAALLFANAAGKETAAEDLGFTGQ